MSEQQTKVDADRQTLADALEKGGRWKWKAYFKLSGPGWLQSAITLGGGSLGSALYLGVLGGWSMLWLQLVAIVVGVIMLSAISYVTLSTGERPYQSINRHINPVLGVGWILATMMANIIWCMPQFSLCFDVLDNNLTRGAIDGESMAVKVCVSLAILAVTMGILLLSLKPGWASKLFDIALKALVGMIVISFFGVVVRLSYLGLIEWNEVGSGFVPDLMQWFNPSPRIAELIAMAPEGVRDFWKSEITSKQQSVMISTTATAVGINMTFLLPYSMLNRGWDKPFRGLASFDLCTGMAIPYVIVTSCVVIASAHSFHAKADEDLLSSDPAIVVKSKFYNGASAVLEKRLVKERGADFFADVDSMPDKTEDEVAAKVAAKDAALAAAISDLGPEERKLAACLVKPNAGMLATSLSPLLGEWGANLVFGIGAFAMGFSTIIILMMINGYVVTEIFNRPDSKFLKIVGYLIAGGVGAAWPWIWAGTSKTWLIIMASTFGAMLLPIAYFTFFAMMNSKSLLGKHKPTGVKMVVWNVLMGIGCLAALAQAISAIATKVSDPTTGKLVIGGAITFVLLALVGFSAKGIGQPKTSTESPG
jgi:Mn2+/Fe2+ NRAMP family transporter